MIDEQIQIVFASFPMCRIKYTYYGGVVFSLMQ